MRILFNIQNRNYSIFMKLFYRFLLISIFSLIAAKAFSNNIPTTQNDQDKLSACELFKYPLDIEMGPDYEHYDEAVVYLKAYVWEAD